MRIAWISHRDQRSKLAGGAERLAQELCLAFARRGHQVFRLVGGGNGSPKCVKTAGIEVHTVGDRILAHLYVPQFLKDAAPLDAVIDDLAHAAPWASEWFTRQPGTALFYHLHKRTLGPENGRLLTPMLRLSERLYPAIYPKWPFVTISNQSRKDLIGLGVASSRITVIYPGVNLAEFTPGSRSRTPELIYFSGLKPYKRPEHALHALKRLSQFGVAAHLLVVGEGPSLPMLIATCSDLGLDSRVTFTGKVDNLTLQLLIRRSWLNICTTKSEGFGLAALEAAASGVPTVAYDVPGLREAIHHRQSGLLVPDGDLDALVSALKEVITSMDAWPGQCVEWARQFSWETAADKWELHLRSLAEKNAT